MWQLFQDFRSWGVEHSRELYAFYIMLAIIASLITLTMWNFRVIAAIRQQLRYRRQENLRLVAFDAVRFIQTGPKRYRCEIVPWRESQTLSQLLHNPPLEADVEKLARDPAEAFLDSLPPDLHRALFKAMEEAVMLHAGWHMRKLDWLSQDEAPSAGVLMCPYTRAGTRAERIIRVQVMDSACLQFLTDSGVTFEAGQPEYEYRVIGRWWEDIGGKWSSPEQSKLPSELRCMRLVRIY